MAIALLLVQLALCLTILYREIVQHRFRHYASSIFFIVYTIVYVAEPLVLHFFFGGATSIVQGSRVKFDTNVYVIYNTYGIALLIAFLLLTSRRSSKKTDTDRPPTTQADLPIGLYNRAVAVLIIVGVGLFVLGTGMSLGDLLSASRFAWFGEADLSLFWLTVASYFLALTAVYAYLTRQRHQRSWWLVLLCFSAIVLHGLITKDRKWVIFLASGWLAGHFDASGRKLAISRTGAIVMSALFGVLVISQFLRDVLFRLVLGEQLDLVQQFSMWWSELIEFGDISYFYRASLEAIHQNLNNGFVVPFALPRRLLFFFLPAGLSGGLKIEDISAIFSDVVNGGTVQRRGNMPPGLFGLFVISFGWLASLGIIPLLAFLVRKLDTLFVAGQGFLRLAVLPLYMFSVVLAFRGDDSSAVYYMISTLMFLFLIAAFTIPTRPRLQ